MLPWPCLCKVQNCLTSTESNNQLSFSIMSSKELLEEADALNIVLKKKQIRARCLNFMGTKTSLRCRTLCRSLGRATSVFLRKDLLKKAKRRFPQVFLSKKAKRRRLSYYRQKKSATNLFILLKTTPSADEKDIDDDTDPADEEEDRAMHCGYIRISCNNEVSAQRFVCRVCKVKCCTESCLCERGGICRHCACRFYCKNL